MTTIAVVGAGVVGAAQALFAGVRHPARRVLVLDPLGLGRAASLGNSGYLCPGLAAAPPAPGAVLRHHRRHRIRVHRATAPQLARWGGGWLAAQAAGAAGRPHRQLREWAARSEREWGRLLGGEPPRGAARLHRHGQVDRSAPARLARLLPHLDPAGVRRLEWCPADTCVDPELAVRRLAERWPSNVEMVRCAVRGFEWRGETITHLRTDGRSGVAPLLPVGQVVLAAGGGTAPLLRSLRPAASASAGAWPPLVSLCGYSVTAACGAGQPPPLRCAISDLDNASTIVPLGEGVVRIAGHLDLAAERPPWADERLDHLEGVLRGLFPRHRFEVRDRWCGFRTATLCGVPWVGPVHPWSNLFCNTGHGRVGMTLSTGTASWLAERL